jgi:hypothetical protein
MICRQWRCHEDVTLSNPANIARTVVLHPIPTARAGKLTAATSGIKTLNNKVFFLVRSFFLTLSKRREKLLTIIHMTRVHPQDYVELSG